MVDAASPAPVLAGHPGGPDDACARVIAFYLPQYHTIPENDLWWGEGFTDWTNVRKAEPQFAGHDQPKVPTALGYYDLRNVDVHYAQAALAREHGIAGFCYYAYWFAGRRLLEEPLQVVASNPDLGMPYAICWANEPWTRRWDGRERDILVRQRHSLEGDIDFIDAIGEHLADGRYMRVNGRPLLLIYRAGLLVEPRRTADALRGRALKLGLDEPYLAMVQSFDDRDPRTFGFDGAVEFPPHGLWPRQRIPRSEVAPREGFDGALLRYKDLLAKALSRPVPDFSWFRGVIPGWDNTPRRGSDAKILVGNSAELFREWLAEALRYTYLFARVSERLVFVNAWNEWAEGAYLEPDQTNGTAYLNAVEEAKRSTRELAAQTAQILQRGSDAEGNLERARSAWRDHFPSKGDRDLGRLQLGRVPPVYRLAKRLARLTRRVQERRG